jgi:hypothetical protein
VAALDGVAQQLHVAPVGVGGGLETVFTKGMHDVSDGGYVGWRLGAAAACTIREQLCIRVLWALVELSVS